MHENQECESLGNLEAIAEVSTLDISRTLFARVFNLPLLPVGPGDAEPLEQNFLTASADSAGQNSAHGRRPPRAGYCLRIIDC